VTMLTQAGTLTFACGHTYRAPVGGEVPERCHTCFPSPPIDYFREALQRIAASYPDVPYEDDEVVPGTSIQPTNRRIAREALARGGGS
jgi:hypothetical protein